MKRIALTFAVVILASPICAQEPASVLSAPTLAQRPTADSVGPILNNEGPTVTNVTPEIWLYMQERQRHDDAEMAVRRKAELRAAQRQNRMAARKWFGLSNSRPTASPIPTMGTYSPFWAGNDPDPNRWNGVSAPVVRIYRSNDGLLR